MGNELSRQVTTVQLWERIHAAGLASSDECRRWARTVAEVIGKNPVGDTQQLTSALVKFGFLTPYQANVLLRDLPHPLLLDDFRIVRSLSTEQGPFWYEGELGTVENTNPAQVTDVSPAKPESRWFVAMPSIALASPPLSAWLPSLQWGERHCEAHSPYLDEWTSVGATLKYLYAAVVPWLLPSLDERAQRGTLSPESACRMVRDIASGLQVMHGLGLVHGHIDLQSIVGDEAKGYRLRRDPLFPPRSPYHGLPSNILEEPDEPFATAAPELFHPNATPTVRSDLYALGCVWYRCLTGQWPFQPTKNAPRDTWALLHAQVPVAIPDSLTESHAKCLAYLLAKDPRTRFASAQAFLKALGNSDIDYPAATVNEPAFAKEPRVPYVSSSPSGAESSSESVKAEQMAAEMREKKSKLAMRYHARPFGTAVPGKTTASDKEKSQKLSQKLIVPVEEPESIAKTAVDPPSVEATPDVVAATEQKDAPKLSQADQGVSTNKPASKAPTKGPKGPTKAPTKGTTKGTTKGPSKGKRKPKRPVWFMPAVIAGSCIVLVGILLALRGASGGIVTISDQPVRKPAVNSKPTNGASDQNAPGKNQPDVDPMAEFFEVKPDEGKVPWAPPTVGSPYSLELLPMGPEMLVFMSNSVWNGSGPVGALANWWRTLHPDDGATLPEAALLAPAKVASVVVAWYPGKVPSTSQRVVRLTFQEAIKLSDAILDLNELWKPATGKSNADGVRSTIWMRKDKDDGLAIVAEAFASTADSLVQRVTIGPAELLESMNETQGASGPLRRQMDALLQTTDRKADVTVVTAPSFLYGDGKEILGIHAPHVLGMLRSVVGDSVQALLMRTHFEPQWYLEWRTLGNDLQAATRNATELKKRLESLPDAIENELVKQPADPYWRAIANRYPQMLRSLARFARAGAEDGHVVINAYLPNDAIQNLAIGSWMVSQRDLTASVAVKPASSPPNTKKSIDQWLDSPISLRVEQDSLENVLQSIASELKESSGESTEPIPMAINGTAFQKDGITRNQQIRGFDYKDTPLRKVLTDLSRKANPVTTVQAPNEKDQKVVWVVLDSPASPSMKKIELTTRAWSTANQAVLPTEFIVPKE